MSGTHRAKIVLGISVLFCGFSVWSVHWLQNFERKTMYQGVIRDDQRRAEKMRKREEELKESAKKRVVYESVQSISEQS